VILLYCRYCNEEIAFDDDYVSEYSGKKIPLDPETHEPICVQKKKLRIRKGNMNNNKRPCQVLIRLHVLYKMNEESYTRYFYRYKVSNQTSFSTVVTNWW
jgi:hypothetical protein